MLTKFVKTLKSRKTEIDEWGEIRDVLENYGVKLAYLFGSYAEGEITEFSDIDIGVIFEQGIKNRIDSLRIDLMELLGEEAIDLIDLEKAPPKLKYNIIKDGEILLGEKYSTEYEVKAMNEYFDFKPLEEEYFDSMKKRIESDRFGR